MNVLLDGLRRHAIDPARRVMLTEATVVTMDPRLGVLVAGFVDTHRHAWEAQPRRIMPDVDDLGEHVTMRPHFGDWDDQWPADLTRLHNTYYSAGDQFLTLRRYPLPRSPARTPPAANASPVSWASG
ncbi:hypothetical protein [Nonomuraea lactucae]|uniref:hypothetical protein n=1 Tax=Nonomuraea lactucae TaxID=2249762 RepID=UPI001F05F0D8|nr:hypothetical protein [Nonomuraea lactucae]